jgi:hypothetical protein
MIRHVVMFTFKDDATEAQIADATAGLSALPGLIPEIKAFRIGRDIGVNQGNFHLAVTADFDDVAGYLVYRDHPEHLKVIREKGSLVVAQRAAVQFEY